MLVPVHDPTCPDVNECDGAQRQQQQQQQPLHVQIYNAFRNKFFILVIALVIAAVVVLSIGIVPSEKKSEKRDLSSFTITKNNNTLSSLLLPLPSPVPNSSRTLTLPLSPAPTTRGSHPRPIDNSTDSSNNTTWSGDVISPSSSAFSNQGNSNATTTTTSSRTLRVLRDVPPPVNDTPPNNTSEAATTTKVSISLVAEGEENHTTTLHVTSTTTTLGITSKSPSASTIVSRSKKKNSLTSTHTQTASKSLTRGESFSDTRRSSDSSLSSSSSDSRSFSLSPTHRSGISVHRINLTQTDPTAVCIDGSSAHYDLYESLSDNDTNSNRWLIHFATTGNFSDVEWCTSLAHCATWRQQKLNNHDNSSLPVTPTSASQLQGLLSRDCTINPTFCKHHVAYVHYCDGWFFSGNREMMLMMSNATQFVIDENRTSTSSLQSSPQVFLRGDSIRRAVFQSLQLLTTATASPFDNAKEVVVSGVGAGAMGVMLHRTSIEREIRNAINSSSTLTLIVFLSDSGMLTAHDVNLRSTIREFGLKVANMTFDAEADTCRGPTTRPEEEDFITILSSRSHHCADPFALYGNWTGIDPAEEVNAEQHAAHRRPPVFVVNTVLDEQRCMQPTRCTTTERQIQYDMFLNRVRQTSGFYHRYNGAFLFSSSTTFCSQLRGASVNDAHWVNTSINGKSLRDAVSEWYAAHQWQLIETDKKVTSNASTTRSNLYLDCQSTLLAECEGFGTARNRSSLSCAIPNNNNNISNGTNGDNIPVTADILSTHHHHNAGAARANPIRESWRTRRSLFHSAGRSGGAADASTFLSGSNLRKAFGAAAASAIIGTRVWLNTTNERALCLDGSSAAYYYFPSTTATTTPGAPPSKKFIMYMMGGGICGAAEDCYERSKTFLGSSSSFAAEQPGSWLQDGMLSRDCTVNPLLCEYNVALVPSCDGFLYATNRTTPVEISNGAKLYFRGAAIVDAVIQSLLQTYSLAHATDIIFSGGSAGALPAFAYGDRLAHQIRLHHTAPTSFDIRSVPDSGFLTAVPNYANVSNINRMALSLQSLGALEDAVVDGYSDVVVSAMTPQHGHQHRPCITPECSLGAQSSTTSSERKRKYPRIPMFALQSSMDSFHIQCNFLGELDLTSGAWRCNIATDHPSQKMCLRLPEGSLRNCSSEQVAPLLAGHEQLASWMTTTSWFHERGNGAFIHSCIGHIGAFSGQWNAVKIRGVSMREAVERWLNDTTVKEAVQHELTTIYHDSSENSTSSDGTMMPKAILGQQQQHHYRDCARPSVFPFQCNPTCGET